LFAAKKSFSGPAIITFKVDEEGVSEFGSDAMALLAISEGMGGRLSGCAPIVHATRFWKCY
jgi:hypothetical protein